MIRSCALLLALVSTAAPAPARAAPMQPPAARAVRVEEHVGAQLPSGLTFVSVQGDALRLGELAQRQLPIVLVLAYARCALLCSWVLHGISEALPKLEHQRPGRDYLPVVVSIDPRETRAQARDKQQALLRRFGGSLDPQSFPYLTGSEPVLRALAEVLGFHYAWDARSEQYAHPAVVFVITPQLRIARYLYGVQFPVTDLGAALRDAARQTPLVASAGVRFENSALLRCFRFEAGAHRYARELRVYFRSAGCLLLLALLGFVGWLLRWERRRAR